MTSVADVKETITKQINKIPNSNLNLKLSFIKKTKLRNPEEKLFPNPVKLQPNMKTYLKTSMTEYIIKKWNEVQNEDVKLRRFNLDSFTSDDYGFIENGELTILDSLIEKINADDGTYIEDLRNMGNSKSFCVQIYDNDKNLNIIVFSDIKYSTVKFDEDIASKMTDKKLEQISDDVVIFSNFITSVYFVDAKLFLLFDEPATENLLGLNEYYKEASKKIILELSPELVDTTATFLDENLTSKKIQSDIVKMQASGQFDKTIENYKKHKELFDSHPDLDPKLTQVDITDDDKIKLDTKEKLETFVHMSKHNILQDPLDTRDLYIVYGKHSMKKQ
jgi:hypothetical protein